MKKLTLIFGFLLLASGLRAQSSVSVNLGSGYANGSLISQLLPPENGNVGTTHIFLDANGSNTILTLIPGKTYGFWADRTDGTAVLYGRVTVTGAPQDITPFLFPLGGGSGTCNIGLSGPGGVFTVTGTPAACNGVLNLIITGTSGGIPCFTTSSIMGSSPALTVNTLPKGGGAGGCVSNSTVTDDAILPTRTPDGSNIATKYIVLEEQNANPGTGPNLLACTSGVNVTTCPVSPAAGTLIGVATANTGNSGTVQIAIAGRVPVFFDNQSTRGDSAIPSATVPGELHDTGGTAAVAGYNFFVDTTNAGAGTIGIVRPPGDISTQGGSLVSCLTTEGDIWMGGVAGICKRLPAPTTPNTVTQFLTSAAAAGVGTDPVYKLMGIKPRVITTTPDPIVWTDRGGFNEYNSASPIAVAIPQAGSGAGTATADFSQNFTFCAENRGAGLVTFTPATSTIQGNATYQLAQNQSACIISDNTNYKVKDSGVASVASTRRVCMMPIGADNGTALVNADLGPQGRLCFVPYGATIVEVTVAADAGTPNVIVGRNRAGVIANITSAALATAASGGLACSNTGGTLGLDGATTCSGTLQNTTLNQGDWLELVSGTAGGTAKRMSVAVTYVVQ